ncbi:hypothetical protein L9F63_010258 [Diploptera punctata]|uniref:Uncharacterized protein n=1 Tax=Diploptera punctata TaxID=6984 RepID=A0AAD8AHN4_DIPPU|nr:hypothetical protein L9F63_010258 [Diploptera punctata]
MSPPDFDLFPEFKENLCVAVVIPLWKKFKWCTGWNNRASETLGFSHTEAGRLY